MSTEKFIITKEDSNYAVIPNSICQKLADAEALGLYVYLVSLPPHWEFYKEVIRKHFGWGRDKLEKKLTVLRTHNLVEAVPERNEKGKFKNWNLHVKNGREFTITHNTENPCSGDLSTGLDKNSTQNTENTAAVKPVTGFDTPRKEIDKKAKAFRKKSSCAVAQKKPKSEKPKSEWRKENAKTHDFAEGKNNAAQSRKEMERESKHIEESQTFKRTPMPESLRTMIKQMKCNTSH
jgi:hypothetical protein